MTDARGIIAAFASGLLFGAGLAVSRMVDPDKVLGFLDVAAIASGGWDPSLVLVLFAATGTNLVGYRIVLARRRPLLAPSFQLPTLTRIDRPLVLGAALFGAGWGLAGYCPGPALSALTHGSTDALWFSGAMLVGMAGFRLSRRPATATA